MAQADSPTKWPWRDALRPTHGTHTRVHMGVPVAAGTPYVERGDADPPWYDTLAENALAIVLGPLQRRWASSPRRLRHIVALTEQWDERLRALSDAHLQQQARSLRPRLRQAGFTPALSAESFALVREAAARTMGRRHYPSQLMAGYAMLQGRLAEMATGEGKTFAATLPASTVALMGLPVHVVTVNDYLAERDAEEMAPLYTFLGLDVGVVTQEMKRPQRRQAYARAITYCTNKDLTFDYLRDRISRHGRVSALHLSLGRLNDSLSDSQEDDEGLVLRGLHFAIVDEADSVFIDEARTPLILSAPGEAEQLRTRCEQALGLAATLVEGEHYVHNAFQRSVSLREAGRAHITAQAQHLLQAPPGETIAPALIDVWGSVRAREELITQALNALHVYELDVHYVVFDGKVQIVDESTGRIMPDRSWERGLHQLIETKEGCELTTPRDTLARLTYQRLFRRYLRLSGMSGTAMEAAGEIQSVYRLPVARIPLHQPSRRVYLPMTMCGTQDEKWQRVAEVAARLQAQGRPVLIGTRSVGASERCSQVLGERGIAHALLNAKQDRAEAEVVAAAGQAGRVTVATNMAGRGTDIRPDDAVASLGGLHVILTEFHESSRVDRQLFGRCARQGDPGSCEAIVALDDEIFTVCAPWATAWLRRMRASSGAVPAWAGQLLRLLAQRSAESRNAQSRAHNMKHDRRLHQLLAFSGRGE
jgi:preprotein translocase subunit SecA